jgi:hypothetical protein
LLQCIATRPTSYASNAGVTVEAERANSGAAVHGVSAGSTPVHPHAHSHSHSHGLRERASMRVSTIGFSPPESTDGVPRSAEVSPRTDNPRWWSRDKDRSRLVGVVAPLVRLYVFIRHRIAGMQQGSKLVDSGSALRHDLEFMGLCALVTAEMCTREKSPVTYRAVKPGDITLPTCECGCVLARVRVRVHPIMLVLSSRLLVLNDCCAFRARRCRKPPPERRARCAAVVNVLGRVPGRQLRVQGGGLSADDVQGQCVLRGLDAVERP